MAPRRLRSSAQDLVDLVQRLQVVVGPALRNHLPDAGIGKPRLGAEHRRVELVARHLAVRADGHVADHRQAVDVRIERAQPVGELLGQHRNHPAREIHRGAPLARILVERIAGAHVVADVGDRHPQAEALAFAHGMDGVVEILGGFAVDGDEGQVPQVFPTFGVFCPHFIRHRLRQRHRLLREFVRQVELAQRDLDFHAGIGVAAQHLDDPADGLRVLRGLRDQFDRSPPAPAWRARFRSAGSGCRWRCAGPRAPGTARRAPCAAGRRCGGWRAPALPRSSRRAGRADPGRRCAPPRGRRA